MFDVVAALSLVFARQKMLQLRRDYDEMFNADPLGPLKHHCYPGSPCRCASVQYSAMKMSRIAVRMLLMRKPARPQVKEWTAVGSAGMFMP